MLTVATGIPVLSSLIRQIRLKGTVNFVASRHNWLLRIGPEASM